MNTIIDKCSFKLNSMHTANAFTLKGEKSDAQFSPDRLDTVEVTLTLLFGSKHPCALF